MVGHHADDLDRQLAGAFAEQQVVEAVAEPGDHHQHPQPVPVRDQVPAHAELLGHRLERGPQGRLVGGQGTAGGRDVHPHEQVPGPPVVELLELGDGEALVDQHTRDGVHDARLLGAVQREHELVRDVTGRGRRRIHDAS